MAVSLTAWLESQPLLTASDRRGVLALVAQTRDAVAKGGREVLAGVHIRRSGRERAKTGLYHVHGLGEVDGVDAKVRSMTERQHSLH